MKVYMSLALGLALGANAADHGSTYGGSGPYKSYYFEVESLSNHTFYQPLESGLKEYGSDLKLPVIVWGNGGCDPWHYVLNIFHSTPKIGLKFRNFLGEITSWGSLAIATGAAFTDPETYVDSSNSSGQATGQNPAALTEAIDWVYENAGKGDWTHIDKTRIGVWGQSCGGLEAYTAGAHDERGERDYASLPESTPAWKGSHTLGHSAAYDLPNAGISGVTARKIMQWVLRGEDSARSWFVGDEPFQEGYVNVTYRNLERIQVTPIQ
ncbi:uncharacterized protein DSM5745_09759 [Aspergillus mulundensis]|uniref:Uncharacterized protein n=1 Tax=Aspergillus mulundensis TaxID=1810919 RepID=A0A3D8QRP6_9EURO|nr:hypothetical protein DSM5745_09759 [Aspergillus mulundensis]RDW64348.1 hypothetical protein DSM5745_09759 [Aspergillus mulundensis]